MWPYWVMFLLPSLAALASSQSGGPMANRLRQTKANLTWAPVWIFGTLLIGYRFQVGGDWVNYFHYLFEATDVDVVDVLTRTDPGYRLLNWMSAQMDWGMVGVNLIGGGIFTFGLLAFCQRQPWPWLALALAIPYLVIVVGMGYTRQSIALGLEMLGLLSLGDRSVLRFVVYIVLAAAFHKTALLLLPIAALASSHNRYWTIAWVGLTAIVMYFLLLAKEVDTLVATYVGGEMQSQGAAIRLLMNAVPASILLIWRSRFYFSESEAAIWRWFAIIALVLLGLFMVLPSASTALDRIALYILPLQLVVLGRLPYVFDTHAAGDKGAAGAPRLLELGAKRQVIAKNAPFITAVVLLYYGLVQFVWLNFGVNALYWLPYRFYPFEFVF